MDNKPTESKPKSKAVVKSEATPKKTSRYFFPDQEVTIEAESLEEATEKVNAASNK